MASNNDRVRFRYGKCLNNDGCSKAKAKEVQEIGARKDFVCAECGKPLHECPRPLTWWEKNGKWVYTGIAAAVVAIVAIILCLPKSEEPVTPEPMPAPKPDTTKVVTSTPVDTAVVEEPAEEQGKVVEITEKDPVVVNGYGTLELSYGTYTGDIKNGKPHGHGTIKYTKRHKIIASKDYVAEPGDSYEGDFRDGRVSGGLGYWTSNGNVTNIKP